MGSASCVPSGGSGRPCVSLQRKAGSLLKLEEGRKQRVSQSLSSKPPLWPLQLLDLPLLPSYKDPPDDITHPPPQTVQDRLPISRSQT